MRPQLPLARRRRRAARRSTTASSGSRWREAATAVRRRPLTLKNTIEEAIYAAAPDVAGDRGRRVSTPDPARLRLASVSSESARSATDTSRADADDPQLLQDHRDDADANPGTNLRSTRSAGSPGRRPPAERCELCGKPAGRASTRTCSSRRAASLLCCCDACAILFSGRRRVAVPPRAAARRGACPTFSSPTRSGRACTCRSTWPSSPQTARPGKCSPSTRARPAPPSRCLPLEAWQDLAAQNPVLARAGARRRGLAGQSRRRLARVLPRADRRMLQAGRPDPHPLARPLGRHGGLARNRAVLRRAASARPSQGRAVACRT